MAYRHMKHSLIASAALAMMLTGCSKPASEEASPAADSAAGADASAVTAADPAVAPDVAFTYRFAFRLPDDAVSDAQDRHVAACATLGQAHCRVAAIAYTRQQDGPVSASASFLLDPALARGFVRDASAAVRSLDGQLLDSNVAGEDVGSGIGESQRLSVTLGGDVARLEARLRQPGLSSAERVDLTHRVEELRGRMAEEERNRRQGEARLASTPVDFAYRGTTAFAGFDSDRPLASALSASAHSLGSASGFVLTLAGLALPWVLMIGGAIALWRWLRRRMRDAGATPNA